MANSGSKKSAEAATVVFDIANWALLGSFVVGGAAAVVILLASIAKEQHWDALRERLGTRVVELESESATTNAELQRAAADVASANRTMAETQRQTAARDRERTDGRDSVAAANDRAAEAEKKAAEASRRLEQYKNPRALSFEHVAQIVERLRSFERTPFDFSLTSDPDAISLMGWVAKALVDSGWQWNGLPAPVVFDQPGQAARQIQTSLSLQIRVDERKKQVWEKPALELRDALKAAGIEATAEAAKADGTGDNAIHIRIGASR